MLQIWKACKAAVREKLGTAERAAKAIQNKLDRLNEAFLFERSNEGLVTRAGIEPAAL